MSLTDNALMFFDLDSNSNDKSGNGHNGTDTSMSYDGTYGVFSGSGYITLADLVSSSPTIGTWSAWVNDISAGGSGYFAVANAGSTNNCFGIQATPAEGYFYGDYGAVLRQSPCTASALYHIVVTSDGTTEKIYVNGVLGIPRTAVPVNVSPTTIGKGPGSWSNMLGKIRCVGLFSDTKDQAWVTSVYNAGVPMKWADMGGGGGGVTGTFYNANGPGSITLTGVAETVNVDNGEGTVTVSGTLGTFNVDNGVGYFVVA